MEKLRSREFTRMVGSFLLAVGFHALFFLIKANGIWGSSGNNPEYILVHPRLIEIESPQVEREPVQRKVTLEEKPTPKALPPEKPPNRSTEEITARVEEVQQENPAARETKSEPGEVVEKRAEEINEQSAEHHEIGEEQTPVAPSLPPLGGAGGMVVFTPRFSYPKSAEHRGVEGKVQLELYLSSEGVLLKEPLITVSSGHPELDEHCLKMFKAKEWKFKPASKPYKIRVEVSFFNNEVESRFLGEAAYLSTEEGGE